MKKKALHLVHPGEVLFEEFLNPRGMSQNKLSVNIGVPARRISEIVLKKREVTADTALRLGRFFGTSPEFWLGLQSQYDLDVAVGALRARLDKETSPRLPYSGKAKTLADMGKAIKKGAMIMHVRQPKSTKRHKPAVKTIL